MERYIHHFGGSPQLAFGLTPGHPWGREILYNLLAMEVAASHGKSERLGAPNGPGLGRSRGGGPRGRGSGPPWQLVASAETNFRDHIG